MKNRSATNFWVDLVSLVVMLGLVMTGGLIYFVLPAGTGHSHTLWGLGRHDFGEVHFYLALAAFALLAVHVVLHWSWFCCMVAKLAGRGEAPSRRARTTWGLSVLVGITIFLVAGLMWASTAVVATGAGGRGRAGRDELVRGRGRGALARLDPAVASSRGGPRAPGLQAVPGARRAAPAPAGAHPKHLEDCAAGAMIDGRSSLAEAARACGVSLEQMRRELGLPRGVDGRDRLGRLRREYAFQIHEVRRLACRQETTAQ